MKIDPTQFAADHPLSIAMRRVSRYWHLAYSKLLSLEWEWDSSFPYGATDGKMLLLNRKGIDQLAAMPDGVDYIAFLLVHESLHALLGHGWRLAVLKNHQVGNIAADYVINAMIQMRNRELKKDVFPLIPGCLINESLSGDKSIEQLYRELLQPDPNPQPQPQPEINPNPYSNEKDDEEDSDQDQDPDQDDEGDDASSDGDSESTGADEPGDSAGDSDDAEDGDEGGVGGNSESPGDGDVEGAGGDDGDTESGGEGGRDGEGEDLTDEGGSDPEPDLKDFPGTGAADTRAPEPEDGTSLKEMIDRLEEDNDRLLASDAIDRQTMSDSGQTGRRVAGARNQGYQMSWATLLHEWLTHHTRNGWNSPFNHAIHSSTGLICSGRRTRAAGSIVWVLDTSGSIGQATYDRFLGEAQAALDELKPESMTLLSVSHIVCDAVILETGDAVPPSLKGGGGTAFRPAFNWVAESGIEPDVLVYLTDGQSPDIGQLVAPDYPVLWLSTREPEKHYPFGEVVPVNGL